MADLGNIALILAFLLSIYSAIVSLLGAWKKIPALIASGRNALYAVCGLLVLASGTLLYALLSHNFSLEYVATNTNRGTSIIYLLSSFYAGNSGALLFWALCISIFGVIAITRHRRRDKALMPVFTAVIGATLAFFTLLMVFVGRGTSEMNPFYSTPQATVDGASRLVLQNLGMIIHPPTLLLGYAAVTIPFAFIIAALVTRRLGNEWASGIRRWAIIAWVFLTIGNLLGAQWAYTQLNWGGYWAWDPVENSSFLPWIMATAFLHSTMIQRKRGMFKVWNVLLGVVTFSLVIFGAFLTRVNLPQSTHNFQNSPAWPYFLTFLALVVLGSLVLLVTRLDDLQSDHELDSLVSRESAFLANNLVMTAFAFLVFLGTVYPALSILMSTKTTVEPSFFDHVAIPLSLVMLLIMGVCPLIGWKKASNSNLLRSFLYPVVAGIVVGVVLGILGRGSWLAILGFSACAFVMAAIFLEWIRGVRARQRSRKENPVKAFFTLVWSNRPRYGGYIVHLGIIIIIIGVIGSHVFKDSQTGVSLSPGQQVSITSPMTRTSYVLKYDGETQRMTSSKLIQEADFSLYRGTDYLGKISAQEQSATTQQQMIVGAYSIKAGFVVQPPLQGANLANGIDLRIADAHTGAAVTGLEKTLKLDVEVFDSSRQSFVSLGTPSLRAVDGDPGHYIADLTTSWPTQHYITLMGTMNGVQVNQTFNCNIDASLVAGIRYSPTEDVYAILRGFSDNQQVSVDVLINPLVLWLWVGGGVLFVGAVIAFWPRRKVKGAAVATPGAAGSRPRGQR